MTATTVTLMQHVHTGTSEASFSGRAGGATASPPASALYTDVPVVVHANEQKALKSEVRVMTSKRAACGRGRARGQSRVFFARAHLPRAPALPHPSRASYTTSTPAREHPTLNPERHGNPLSWHSRLRTSHPPPHAARHTTCHQRRHAWRALALCARSPLETQTPPKTTNKPAKKPSKTGRHLCQARRVCARQLPLHLHRLRRTQVRRRGELHRADAAAAAA